MKSCCAPLTLLRTNEPVPGDQSESSRFLNESVGPFGLGSADGRQHRRAENDVDAVGVKRLKSSEI
jgi:hypothetical protein